MAACAAGHSPAPTPAPGTGSRSPPTSADQTSSTRPWPTSPRPTPTRTNATTRHWPTRSPPGAYKPRWAPRPPPGPDRRPNTDTSAVPPTNDAETSAQIRRRNFLRDGSVGLLTLTPAPAPLGPKEPARWRVIVWVTAILRSR